MEKIIKKCDKCKTVIEKINVCDVCGKELYGYSISIWEDIERSYIEDDGYGFSFDVCSIECALKQLKKQTKQKSK